MSAMERSMPGRPNALLADRIRMHQRNRDGSSGVRRRFCVWFQDVNQRAADVHQQTHTSL